MPARLVGRPPAWFTLGARRDQHDALGAQCCSLERRTRGVAWARPGVVEAAKRTARCALSRGAGRSSEAVSSRRKRSSYHSVPGARRMRSHPWASRSALRAASAARALVSCLVGLLSFQGRRQARKDCETQSAPGLPCSRAKNCAVAYPLQSAIEHRCCGGLFVTTQDGQWSRRERRPAPCPPSSCHHMIADEDRGRKPDERSAKPRSCKMR